ncbi:MULTISPECIES: glycosyltransferase family 87 protein [unclassified Roseibium]|uniref:glycosyltransferase family 87 protein n=1 Tax=unclassified Roseibium TaxID=2629323 RepID=UPI00273E588C|nr:MULTISPECIES: glycosyltransferase family 87 protein [unclassified Roseibium]
MLSLANGTWAKADRLLLIGVVSSISFFVFNVLWQVDFAKTMPDGTIVLVSDFLSFWMAARQVLMGMPEVPYDINAFIGVQELYNDPGVFFAFFYPPMYLMMITPLGFFSSTTAYIVFQGFNAVALSVVMKKIARHWLAVFLVFGSPAAYMSMMNGQNGLLTAFLFGAGLLCLKNQRLVLAGVFIGLLTTKPQLGVLIPFALLAGGFWITFLSAVVTTLLLAGASWIVFGSDTWLAFLQQIPAAQLAMTDGFLPVYHLASVFGFIVGIGGSVGVASVLQFMFGLFLVVITVWTWRKQINFEAKAIVLLSASTLISPFIFVYDLTLLSLAIAFLVGGRENQKLPPWTTTLCASALLITGFSFGIAQTFLIQLGPLAGLLVLIVGLRLAVFGEGTSQVTANRTATQLQGL